MVEAKAEGRAVWVSPAASVLGLGVETCLRKHRCPALPAGGVCPTPLPLVRAAVPASLPSSPIFSLWFTNPAAAGVSEHFTESGQSLTLNDNRISPKLYMTLALKANTFIWIDVITGSATRIQASTDVKSSSGSGLNSKVAEPLTSVSLSMKWSYSTCVIKIKLDTL